MSNVIAVAESETYELGQRLQNKSSFVYETILKPPENTALDYWRSEIDQHVYVVTWTTLIHAECWQKLAAPLDIHWRWLLWQRWHAVQIHILSRKGTSLLQSRWRLVDPWLSLDLHRLMQSLTARCFHATTLFCGTRMEK